jgi:1-deoxy-D-xylulose-5-phosphate reductoisomerase
VGLAARQDWQRLAAQARAFAVPAVALADQTHENALREACPPGTRIYLGTQGLVDLVRQADADLVLAGIVGVAGLPAVLAAVERGIDVGLANKESLVVAGTILLPLARQRGARLIPVDSEHSAIFQALHAGKSQEVRRIYLTGSGGPFRTWPPQRIANASVEEALAHPTWSMGPKVTIDSATMMNKALEIIEAHYLFGVSPEQIEVLIHPESIVHSMVEFCDGSIVAQLGTPDMRTPIQYAITYPERLPGLARPLSWSAIRTLHFEPPDPERFPSIELGHEAARRGGTCGAVLNAANEAAVECFRSGEIPFGRIAELAAQALRRHQAIPDPTLEELMEADAWARREVHECIRVGTC